MSDLISRQDVIIVLYDCAVKSNMKGRVALLHARDMIHELPSVEPNKCGDCISREAALEILDDYAEDIESGNWGTAYSKARTSMCELPSVDPERKPGHWEWDQRTGEYVCSECGCNPIYEGITPDVSEIDKYRYCRWCGVKMEVEK